MDKVSLKISKLPEVMRFMDKVVEAFGYNVSMMRTLEGKYYATLQAFELDVLDKSGFSEKQKLQMLTDGKIDNTTMTKFDQYLAKMGINIPEAFLQLGQVAAEVVKKGQREYFEIDNRLYKKGLPPLITRIVKVKGTSEDLINDLIERRAYILDYVDDIEYFLGLGKKGRERRAIRREERHVRKLEKRQQKHDNKVLRIRERNAGRSDRRALATVSKVSGAQSNAAQILGNVDLGAIAGAVTGRPRGAVNGTLGGKLGNVFAGGGEFPNINIPDRLKDLPENVIGAILGGENRDRDDNEKTLQNALLVGGGILGVIVIIKMIK